MKGWIINQYAIPYDYGASRPRVMVRELRRHGLATTLLLSPRPEWSEIEHEAEIPYVPLYSMSYAGNGMRRVVSMFSFGLSIIRYGLTLNRDDRPHFIIGSSPHPIGAYAGSILAKFWRVPFILEIRDIWPLSIQKMYGMSNRHPLIVMMSAIEKRLYNSASLLILLFPKAASHIEEVLGRPVDFVTVPNGVDLSAWPARSYLPSPEGTLNVVYTGALGVPNSLETVVEAARILQARNSRIQIDLYGEGVRRVLLEKLRDDYKLRNLRIHASVNKEEVRNILAEADVLLIAQKDTDLYSHGLSPNKLSEYMVSGRPIVNAIRQDQDIVGPVGAGWCVEPENPEALANLLAHLSELDRNELQARGVAGRQHAENNYDWSRNLEGLAHALRRLLLKDRDPKVI